MPWAKFDDRFPSNRKIRLLSDGAFRLYVSAVCWSAENLTDGVIKTAELRLVADVRAARTRAKELVEHELWEEVSNVGWRIHDYHEYQPTAAQVKKQRADKTARQRRWRGGSGDDGEEPDGAGVDASTDASRDASQDASRDGAGDAAPSRTRPVPPPVGTGGESFDPSRQTAAHPSLRSGRLPLEGMADADGPGDSPPVVDTATIPVRGYLRGRARGASVPELLAEKEAHMQGCGYCQQGPKMCDEAAAILTALYDRAPDLPETVPAPF